MHTSKVNLYSLFFYIFDIVQKEFYTCLDLKTLRFWHWIRTSPQRFVDRQRLKPLRKPLALTSTRALLTMIMLIMMLSLAATGPRQTAVRAVGEPHRKRARERQCRLGRLLTKAAHSESASSAVKHSFNSVEVC